MAEIDLHGLTQQEAIQAFVEFYNKRVKAGNKEAIDIIHGYGSSGVGGVLKKRIRSFLERNSSYLGYDFVVHGVFQNPGQTRVYPKKPLPSIAEGFHKEIVEFCENPKTLSKISGKFRKYGDQEVLKAVRQLEKSGLLKCFNKGSHKVYQALA